MLILISFLQFEVFCASGKSYKWRLWVEKYFLHRLEKFWSCIFFFFSLKEKLLKMPSLLSDKTLWKQHGAFQIAQKPFSWQTGSATNELTAYAKLVEDLHGNESEVKFCKTHVDLTIYHTKTPKDTPFTLQKLSVKWHQHSFLWHT